jgi:hypothetical protein
MNFGFQQEFYFNSQYCIKPALAPDGWLKRDLHNGPSISHSCIK